MTRKLIYKILFIAAFIVFLIFTMPLILFTPAYIDSETSIDKETTVHEPQVGGMTIQFEEGATESEVKAILEKCNMLMYRLDYDLDSMADKYYITIENNKTVAVGNESKAAPDIDRGGYYIISLSEQAIEDKSILEMLDKNNLQLKKFVWCYIHFGDESKYWIPEMGAVRIKNELEMNETVLNVFPEYLEGQI